MEESTNCKPNELGGASDANYANDWRSQHEPQLRKVVLSKIVEILMEIFPMRGDVSDIACKIEEKIYNIAVDKTDYIQKLSAKMHAIKKTFKNVQSGSSANGANTPAPARVGMNQAQSLPTSLPYTQTPTSQRGLPQNTPSNLNVPGSSRLPTQAPLTASMAQNVNIHIGEGGQVNVVPGSQREMQGRQNHLPQQHQLNQYLLKEKTFHGNLRPPHMHQPQPHPQSLLKQPIQQSLSQSSGHSSLPSSGQQTSIQQNSQSLPGHHFPTQQVRSSSQPQMVLLSQEHSELMNVPNTHQNHPTSQQIIQEQQGAFRVSSPQENNVASSQKKPHHNNNTLQTMPPQRLNNASGVPSQRHHQSGNYNAPGSSLLGTHGQEVGQSQPMMSQQYQPPYPMHQHPQKRSSQEYLDSSQNYTQRFQASSSLHQTQKIANQQNHPHPSQREPLANPSKSQDSVNATGDWQEETYQKIIDMKEMHLPNLSTLLHRLKEKLWQIETLPPEKMVSEPVEKLKMLKLSVEQVMVFLNVQRSSITEKHRDKFDLYKEHILKLTKNHTMLRRPMQQQQGHFPPSQIHQTTLQQPQSPQVHMSQSHEKDQMKSQLMSSNKNGASSSHTDLLQTRPKLEPREESNMMASSGNVMLPSLQQNPASTLQTVHSNITSAQPSSMFQPKQQKQFHHRQTQQPLFHRQQQQQPQQENQQLQTHNSHHMTNEMNDVRMSHGVNIKAQLLHQHLSLTQHQLTNPMSYVISPSASSPQIQPHSSPQQILPATVNQTGTSSMSSCSPFVSPSVESPVSHAQSQDSSVKLGTQATTERPIDRLVKAFQSASPRSLEQSASEISSIIGMVDRIAGSFHPSGRSRAGLGEDLSFQTRNLTTHEEENPTKRLKRLYSTLPRDMVSQTDSYNQFSSLESEIDSTSSSSCSRDNKNEHGCALLQEIREINGRLVETVVEICDEDTCGAIVTCSYAPVGLSSTFKDHYKSGKILFMSQNVSRTQSQIQPLRLLVPANYPYNSPILLEDITYDTSLHNYEDLSARTRSRFIFSVKELSEPMSLKEIAQRWNDCARATMVEYAERHGGGTFSSKYGSWETVLRAS